MCNSPRLNFQIGMTSSTILDDWSTRSANFVSSTLFVFGSVRRSVSRVFVCSFVPSHFIYFILFLPNYNVQFLVRTHGEAEEVTLFCFVFFILTSLQSNSTSEERAARAVNLHCTCKVFPRPQEWLICILSVFDTRTNFQQMASFWGRNNWQRCFENFEFTKITMI